LQDGAFAAGTRSIAAAVLGQGGRPVGAVSVAVGAGRYELAELERQFSPLLIGCAAEISARLRAPMPEPPSEAGLDADVKVDEAAIDTRSRYHVEALARGLLTLRSFSGARPRLSLTELAKRTHALLPTAYRVVSTLVSLGYVELEAAASRYRLTPKVLELGYEGLSSLSFPELLSPRLQRFQEATGLNVFLSVVASDSALDVLSFVTPGTLSTVGRSYPLYCTPGGKVLLAFMEPESRRRILANLEFTKRTPKTLTDAQALEREIDQVRKQGYSISLDEYLPGIRGIGVPVINSRGECLATVACTVPHGMSIEKRDWDAIVSQAVALSEDMSARVGARFN
jgi:IclR family pca regulon transcriptional regulator